MVLLTSFVAHDFDAHPLPTDFELTQLLLLHRHGERTCVADRFPEHAIAVDVCRRRAELASPRAAADKPALRVREHNVTAGALRASALACDSHTRAQMAADTLTRRISTARANEAS